MSQPVTDDTHVDAAASEQPSEPAPFGNTMRAPSPADLAQQAQQSMARQQPAPPAPPAEDTGDDKPKGKKLETIEDYEKALAETRKESAERRVKLRELEPLAAKYREIEESKKDEIQKANERAEAAEKRAADRDMLDIAINYGIEPDNIDLIGSGSREEMAARASRVKAMQDANSHSVTPPPTDRPVEGLRPGASPEPPKPADDSYPESWKPAYLRDNERSQYGQ